MVRGVVEEEVQVVGRAYCYRAVGDGVQAVGSVHGTVSTSVFEAGGSPEVAGNVRSLGVDPGVLDESCDTMIISEGSRRHRSGEEERPGGVAGVLMREWELETYKTWCLLVGGRRAPMWTGTAAREHCGMVMCIILLSDSNRRRRFELGLVEVLVVRCVICVALRYQCPREAVLWPQPIRPDVGAEAARPSSKPPAHITPPGSNRINPTPSLVRFVA